MYAYLVRCKEAKGASVVRVVMQRAARPFQPEMGME